MIKILSYDALCELDIKLTELIRSIEASQGYDRELIEENIVRLINQYQKNRSND